VPKKSRPRSRRKIVPVAVVALILTGLAHGRALKVPFLWDDDQIFATERIRDPAYLISCFRFEAWRDAQTGRFSPYRPLREVSHTATALLLGARPASFHLVSLIFHAINIVLVFALARALTRSERIAWLSAALFASIPAHVEAVTYAKNVAETQALCLTLVSALLAIRAVRRTRRPALWILLATATYAAALLTKEAAWPLPLLLVAWLLIARPRQIWNRKRRIACVLAPLLLIAVTYAGLQLHLRNAGQHSRFVAKTTALPATTRIELASRTVFIYLGRLAFPSVQKPWTRLATPPSAGAGVVAAAVLAAVMLWAAARRRPVALVSLGAWWTVLALGPVSNLVAANTSRPIASQRLYTPSVGYALLLGALLAGWPRVGFGRRLRSRSFKRTLSRVTGIAVASGIALCWTATSPWTGRLRFWRRATRTCPQTYQAHYNLGLTYARRGNDALAVPAYQRALAARPDDVDTIYNLANAQLRLGRLKDAEPLYRKALSLSPDHVGALNGLAGTLANLGNYEEAGRAFLKARRLSPGSAPANRGLLRVYNVTGRYERTVTAARAAIEFLPRDAEVHLELGYALLKLGRRDEAERCLKRAKDLGAGDSAQKLLDMLGSSAPSP